MFPSWATLPFEEYRARRIARYLLPHLSAGERVLDCGCGSMLITRWLRTSVGVRAYGTDVINLNRTDLNLCLSAGERLPFASNSLDTVCLVFVLHHVHSPTATLRECLRVARRQILVAEDVFETALELRLLKVLDWVGNRSISSAMSLPFNFKTERQWAHVFRGLGLRIAQVQNMRPLQWRPSRHRLFVLEKQPASD